jgi:peptidoglycan hydrolase FlgJ
MTLPVDYPVSISVGTAPTGRIHQNKFAPDNVKNLDQACRDFESLFVHYMLKEMRKTIPQDGPMNGGQGEQIYSEMLDSEMAKQISNRGGIGLASVIYSQAAGLLKEK